MATRTIETIKIIVETGKVPAGTGPAGNAAETGGNGLPGFVYLGIAGREFLVTNSNGNFVAGSPAAYDTFVFGSGSNINVAGPFNDPRLDDQLYEDDLNKYPIWIRYDSDDAHPLYPNNVLPFYKHWLLTAVTITVTVKDPSGATALLPDITSLGNGKQIWLGKLTGQLFIVAPANSRQTVSAAAPPEDIQFAWGNQTADSPVSFGVGCLFFKVPGTFGKYDIVFIPEFDGPPAVSATVTGDDKIAPGDNATIASLSPVGVRVHTGDSGVAAGFSNRAFSFIAIGKRLKDFKGSIGAGGGSIQGF